MEERFWKRVQKTETCWLWTGAKNKKGYGTFYISKYEPIGAHRFSYLLAEGKSPEELFVCHKCDNPSCVRPDHLFLGTNTDNMRDAKKKGRLKRERCYQGIHLLMDGNERFDKKGRRCRLCSNTNYRKNYHMRKNEINACRRRLYKEKKDGMTWSELKQVS